jgi:flagellar basal-body rod protein FlgB
MKIFNNQPTVLLKRSLDVLMRHNRNIAENVSNLNVEGYERKPTRFLEELSEAQRRTILKTTNSRHIEPDPSDYPPPEWERGPVEITREMADLAQNQIRYDFSTRVMRRKFEGLTRAITGRIR